MKKNRAILLLSGGIDSTTLLAEITKENMEIYALSFNYNQKHFVELDMAKMNAEKYNVHSHEIVSIDSSLFSTHSSLINKVLPITTYESPKLPVGITNVYVPGRNLLFLSYAVSYAETINCHEIYIAINKDDGNNFPDCTPSFIDAINLLLSTMKKKDTIKIRAPYLFMTKAEIIQRSRETHVDLKKTISCYQPHDTTECGICLSCNVKRNAINSLDS